MNLTTKQLKHIINEEINKLLNEVGRDDWGWNKAPDNDFQFDTDLYKGDRSSRSMVFSQNVDDYVENREFTHGALSHALKHFAEWDLKTVIDDVKDIYDLIKNELGSQSFWFIDVDGRRTRGSLRNLKVGDVGNTIDMVNDKFLEGKSLLPIEQSIYDKAKSLADKYNEAAQNIIEKAFDLSDANIKDPKELDLVLKRHRYVKFRVYEPVRNQYLSSDHLFDMKKGIRVIIFSNGNIATAYKVAGENRDPAEVLKDYIAKRKLEQIPGKGIFNLRVSAAYEADPKLQQDFSDPASVAELIKLNKQRKKFAYDPEKSDAINRASQRIEKSLSKLDKQRWNNLKLQSKNRSKIVDPYAGLSVDDDVAGGSARFQVDPRLGYKMLDEPGQDEGALARFRDVPLAQWRKKDKDKFDAVDTGYAPTELQIYDGDPSARTGRRPYQAQNPGIKYDQLSQWLKSYGPARLASITDPNTVEDATEEYLTDKGKNDAKANKPKANYSKPPLSSLTKFFPDAQLIYDDAYDKMKKKMQKKFAIATVVNQVKDGNQISLSKLKAALANHPHPTAKRMATMRDQAFQHQPGIKNRLEVIP